jgi:hypothetical protein
MLLGYQMLGYRFLKQRLIRGLNEERLRWQTSKHKARGTAWDSSDRSEGIANRGDNRGTLAAYYLWRSQCSALEGSTVLCRTPSAAAVRLMPQEGQTGSRIFPRNCGWRYGPSAYSTNRLIMAPLWRHNPC